MSQLTQGETRRGTVTSITNFGAFVDLGGADGLIHVSELSWGRVDNPRQVIKVGDELEVYVLDVDQQRKRIALSLKKLQPDPWTIVDEHYHQGQLVEGHVTRVLDFGAFVELGLGVEGLLHASEMIGTPELPPNEIVHPGEKLLVKIIRIDSRRRRLALSARQVRKSEWERWVAEQQQIQEHAEAEAAAAAAAAVTGEGFEAQIPMPEEAAGQAAAVTGEGFEAEIPMPEEAAGQAAAVTGAGFEAEIPMPEEAAGEAAEEMAGVPEAIEAAPQPVGVSAAGVTL
jgi:small subunit ribosomal protein S1